MNLRDVKLIDAMKMLSPAERKAVRDHLAGKVSDESRELIRALRRKLKRKIRARVPRLKWLA
jgi:hypothetical protein